MKDVVVEVFERVFLRQLFFMTVETRQLIFPAGKQRLATFPDFGLGVLGPLGQRHGQEHEGQRNSVRDPGIWI